MFTPETSTTLHHPTRSLNTAYKIRNADTDERLLRYSTINIHPIGIGALFARVAYLCRGLRVGQISLFEDSRAVICAVFKGLYLQIHEETTLFLSVKVLLGLVYPIRMDKGHTCLLYNLSSFQANKAAIDFRFPSLSACYNSIGPTRHA